jgi:hypothetical protein
MACPWPQPGSTRTSPIELVDGSIAATSAGHSHAGVARGGTEMTRRTPPRKVTYFEPVPPLLARNTIIESTFEVGRRFRCTMRVDCGQLDPDAVIRPEPGEWQPAHARAPR